MHIEPGPGDEDRKIELDTTEARQARPGYNIHVLIFGLIGVVIGFIIVLSQ